MKTKAKIKNYTTEVSHEKTIIEINQILVKARAKGIATEFDDEGLIKAIFFRIDVSGKELTFKLPAKPDAVYRKLYAGIRGSDTYGPPRRRKSIDIAWRIVKDWLEVQIAMIELEQAEAAEVFFPYLLVGPDQTIYEQAKQNKFLLGTGMEAS